MLLDLALTQVLLTNMRLQRIFHRKSIEMRCLVLYDQ